MVRAMTSTNGGGSNDVSTVPVLELKEGDMLVVNYAPDALVLNVDPSSSYQTIVDIRHANGDERPMSYKPDELVKIRKRQT